MILTLFEGAASRVRRLVLTPFEGGVDARGMVLTLFEGVVDIRRMLLTLFEGVADARGTVLTLFEGVVDVEQRQVIAVNVRESHLGLVGGLPRVIGPHETLWD